MFLDECSIYGIGGKRTEPDTRYSGNIAGLQIAMIESYENDMNLFKGMLYADAKEIALTEAEDYGELFVFQEGILGDMWTKVKNLWERIKKKIKGVLHNFVARLSNWMGKNGYDYYKKYIKEVQTKDLSGLEIRYSEPKKSATEIVNNWMKIDSNIYKDVLTEVLKDKDKDNDDIVVGLLNAKFKTNCNDLSDFKQDVHELYFEDEEKDYKVSGKFTTILEPIASADIIKKLQKVINKHDTEFKSVDREMRKSFTESVDMFNEADDTAPPIDIYPSVDTGGDKNKKIIWVDANGKSIFRTYPRSISDIEYINKWLGKSYIINNKVITVSTNPNATSSETGNKALACLNAYYTKADTVVMTEIKFAVAQARRAMAAMIVYNPKKSMNASYEEKEISNFIQEAVEADVYSDFEAF